MELFWVDLWLCIWSVWKNLRMRYTSVMTDKSHFLGYEWDIWNHIWIILGSVDLNTLVIPRITSRFRWVKLTYFVDCLMECIWVESYIHMTDCKWSLICFTWATIIIYLSLFGSWKFQLTTRYIAVKLTNSFW